MAENVGVSRDKLVSTASSIRENNTGMKKQLDNVLQAINDLNKDWQSEASKNLKSIAANMQERFSELYNEVETFGVWLDNAAANYATTESGAEETAQKIDGLFK